VSQGQSRTSAALITGTIGSGKTAVATEIGDLLGERGLSNAVIDLDWLGWFTPGPGYDVSIDELIVENLERVVPTFLARGARYLVLTRALEEPWLVSAIPGALGDTPVTVVRLTASRRTIEERLRRRDSGTVLEEHLLESVAFSEGLDKLNIDHINVDNDRHGVRDAALEVIRVLGWP
jgi:hypothetical protein